MIPNDNIVRRQLAVVLYSGKQNTAFEDRQRTRGTTKLHNSTCYSLTDRYDSTLNIQNQKRQPQRPPPHLVNSNQAIHSSIIQHQRKWFRHLAFKYQPQGDDQPYLTCLSSHMCHHTSWHPLSTSCTKKSKSVRTTLSIESQEPKYKETITPIRTGRTKYQIRILTASQPAPNTFTNCKYMYKEYNVTSPLFSLT